MNSLYSRLIEPNYTTNYFHNDQNHQIKNWNEIVCMTWVISLPSCHAKSLDHNWLIWVVLLLMLSLTPFLFILGVCVLGGGLFFAAAACCSSFKVYCSPNRE